MVAISVQVTLTKLFCLATEKVLLKKEIICSTKVQILSFWKVIIYSTKVQILSFWNKYFSRWNLICMIVKQEVINCEVWL